MTVSAMLGLQRLLDSGYEVTFQATDGAAADGSRLYECRMITPDGKSVTANGTVPADAMRGASQLQGDGCQVTYAAAADGTWFADLRNEDGRCMQTGLGATKAGALAHLRERLHVDGRDVFDPSAGEAGHKALPPAMLSERVASLEVWAEAVRARQEV